MQTQPILEAQHADGFVDYYALIGAPIETSADDLREQINARYKEAQTDRDHRAPARRQEASLQLEFLPQARTVLLDAKRRRRYDAYRKAVEMQSPRMPFEEFLPTLLRDAQVVAPNADILSLSGGERAAKTPAPGAPVARKMSAPALSIPAFSMPALVCGAATLCGLTATLPTIAAVPLFLAVPLSLLSAFVVTHVLSQAAQMDTAQA